MLVELPDDELVVEDSPLELDELDPEIAEEASDAREDRIDDTPLVLCNSGN